MSPAIPEDAPNALDPLPPHSCRTSGCAAHSGGDPVWHGSPFRDHIRLINAFTMKDTADRQYFRTDLKANTRRRLRADEDYRLLNKALNEWHRI